MSPFLRPFNYASTGVSFFQDHRYPIIRPELKLIARELQSMGDILAAGKTVGDIVKTNAPVQSLVKEYKGQRVWIIANTAAQIQSGQFETGKIPTTATLRGNLHVVGEKRTVSVNKASWKDDFAPYAVHIYTTAADESKILHAR